MDSKKLRDQVAELRKQLAEKKNVPQELQMLRAENQRLRRKNAVNDAAVDVITNVVKDVLDQWDFSFDIPEPPKAKKSPDEPCIALAHLTDWQCGKVTKTYSSEICRERMMEYAVKVDKAIHRRNASRMIDTLHVYWTGDMVEGELIFPHQAHEIDQSVFDQAVITVPQIMTEQILYWLQSFRTIKIFAVHGNHGRPASKHAGSNPRTNWDRVAYHVARTMIQKAMIESKLDPKRVEISIAEDFYVIDHALGHRNLLVHGDQGIRGFGGFPWYGVGKKMWGWIDSIPEKWQNLYFGHFHQFASADLNGRRWYCGGTPESDNSWARAELAAQGRPQQRLQILNSEQVVCDLPIYLNKSYR